MIIKIGEYTADIKVKGKLDNKNNDEDLFFFLSAISLALIDGSNFRTGQGDKLLANEYIEMSKDIGKKLRLLCKDPEADEIE